MTGPDGKTANVTGASSGIGASTSRALMREGEERTQIERVNIDEIVVKALAQASGARVVRAEE